MRSLDRLLTVTLIVSLAGHALVLGAECLMPGWGQWSRALKPLKLVYEPESPQDALRLGAEIKRMTGAAATELPDPSAVPQAGSGASGYQRNTFSAEVSALVSQISVGDLLSRGGTVAPGSSSDNWRSAVDLTNLAAASQGNPLLYSYFGAIRERIQQTANAQPWLPESNISSGTVYVGFVLNRNGTIESAGVAAERSNGPVILQRVALRIVKASEPFLPFPPSFTESSMAILVPIEFASSPE